MFDFDDLEEKEVTDAQTAAPEAPAFSAPPEPQTEDPVEPHEEPQTPAPLRRPPGLPSPPTKVTANVIHLSSPQELDHVIGHEELRLARDAAAPRREAVMSWMNAQFLCSVDASGRDLDVLALNSGTSNRIHFAAPIRSCSLRERHLLVAGHAGTVTTHRLESGGAAVVASLQFGEDPPKEVMWHPTNQKVFLTLHASRVRLWNLQLLQFTTMGQVKNGVMVTPELLEASCGEAISTDPKETLQHMAVSPSGRYVCAVSEKRFWRWSLRGEDKPEASDLEIFDLEGVDASEELRSLDDDHVLMLGHCEVTLCGTYGERLHPMQRLHFQSPIRCQPQTGCLLVLLTASQEDGQVDLVLQSALEPSQGFRLQTLATWRLVQDASEMVPPMPMPQGPVSDAEWPPGLVPLGRPPGLPSPPSRGQTRPPGLAFDLPPGFDLNESQVDVVGPSQPSQSQSSARSFEKAEAPMVESSDELSGDAKPEGPAEKTPMVRELSSFMQKRADRASDAVVDQVLQTLPTSSGDARKIMHECRQLEEQTQRTQRQVLKVLERPRQPSSGADLTSLKKQCTEAVQSATSSAHFPAQLGQTLAEEPRAEVIRQHLRPSKEKITEVLQKLPNPTAEVKSSMSKILGEKLAPRQALESFMAEVSSQSMREMRRLLAEVQDENLQSGITDACRRRVQATLRQEVHSLKAEVNSPVTSGSIRDALMRRLGQKAMPLHAELDQIDKELHAAGKLLANKKSAN